MNRRKPIIKIDMCCFIIPLAQAVVTTVVRKANSKKISKPESSFYLRQLPTLEKMLWGGSVMLIVDHIISGELSWSFPFFTALTVEGGAEVMLHEMLTTGTAMSLVISLVWVGMVKLAELKAARR